LGFPTTSGPNSLLPWTTESHVNSIISCFSLVVKEHPLYILSQSSGGASSSAEAASAALSELPEAKISPSDSSPDSSLESSPESP
jgi:hypothetical protein